MRKSNRKTNKLLTGVLVSSLLIPCNVFASTVDNNIKDKKSEILEVENKMNNMKLSIFKLEFEIKSLNEEKKYIEKRIYLINEKITRKKEDFIDANLELSKLRNDINDIEKELKTRESLFKDRLNSLYKSKFPGLFDVILASEGFGDMISKLVAYKKIVSLDNQIIEDYMGLVTDLENKENKTKEVINNINEVMDELTELSDQARHNLSKKQKIEEELLSRKYELNNKLYKLTKKKNSLSLELESLKKEKEFVNKRSVVQNLTEEEVKKIREQVGDISKKEINEIIDTKAKKYGIPANLIRAVIQQESGFNPNAVNVNTNGTIDRGIMQINSGTAPNLAKMVGIDYKIGIEFVPEIAIEMGAFYIKSLYVPDNLHKTLTSYNRGSAGAARWYKEHGTYATEYSIKVLNYKEVFDKKD